MEMHVRPGNQTASPAYRDILISDIALHYSCVIKYLYRIIVIRDSVGTRTSE